MQSPAETMKMAPASTPRGDPAQPVQQDPLGPTYSTGAIFFYFFILYQHVILRQCLARLVSNELASEVHPSPQPPDAG